MPCAMLPCCHAAILSPQSCKVFTRGRCSKNRWPVSSSIVPLLTLVILVVHRALCPAQPGLRHSPQGDEKMTKRFGVGFAVHRRRGGHGTVRYGGLVYLLRPSYFARIHYPVVIKCAQYLSAYGRCVLENQTYT